MAIAIEPVTVIDHEGLLNRILKRADKALYPFRCECGDRAYPTEDLADFASAMHRAYSGKYKCGKCGTFATDHTYWPGYDGRCADCDIRYHSHRK